ncbi:hypothetical protein BDQ17DRAFT_346676 [Cyathus striatus]|nr:hypothetical protein BDQ17DRAFT_346676 [Cyathus striatus]
MLLLGLDSVNMFFMVLRGIQSVKSGANSSLMRTVYRDGISYYIYLVGASFGTSVLDHFVSNVQTRSKSH